MIRLENVCKNFGDLQVLKNVNLEVKEGEKLVIIGPSGSGKSTTVRCMNFLEEPTSGQVYIDGQKLTHANKTKIIRESISMVFQQFNLYPHMTVLKNLTIAPMKLHHKSKKEAEDLAYHYLDVVGLRDKAHVYPTTLSGGQQQRIAIARALCAQTKIILFDEPTSALTAKEIDDLFRIIKDLRSKGCGIVYISHRLEELQHIVDRVTIMRDGQYITSMNFKDTTMDQIIANMVGREIKEQFPRESCKKGEKILEVKGLNAGRMVRDINFALYEGEIVGFAGLMGAGRTETTRAIFGVDPKDSGEIILEGKTLKITNPNDAIRAGIVLAPEDRKKDGLCTKLSIRHNIALPNLDILCNKLGVVSSKKEDQMCDEAVENLKIKTPNVDINAGNLSGGNQQKVVVGKWLARNSKVVIFDEPTRGIDVAAKVEIYNLMNELKKQGIAVMFVSSEMPEVMGIADRIIVMCDGRITGELDARNTTQNEILTLATQFEKKIAANA